MTNHKSDTDDQVFFYEQDFYVLSNFSAFTLSQNGIRFMTSEHAYQWQKFTMKGEFLLRREIEQAPSAHEAFKIAQAHDDRKRADWDEVKLTIMKRILHEKAYQHEYVKRKLLATGDRVLIEDSWRDDFWGWGPNQDGQNMLGKLWMEVRAEIRVEAA
jgi:ribA/ribD-fused uncharacterized protein